MRSAVGPCVLGGLWPRCFIVTTPCANYNPVMRSAMALQVGVSKQMHEVWPFHDCSTTVEQGGSPLCCYTRSGWLLQRRAAVTLHCKSHPDLV